MWRLCAISCLALFPAAAAAADYPERIRRAVETMQKVCSDIGGKPGSFKSAVISRDVDGNGQPDYVLDLGNVACEGRPQAYCVSGFCALEVYTWRAENDWRPLLSATVSDWRTARVGDRPSLVLTQRGSFCGKPKQKVCTVTYTFADGRMSADMK